MAPLNSVARQIDSELHAITTWLQQAESDHFLVTSHVNPDGDGLASMLACGRILRSLGKQVWLVADGFLSFWERNGALLSVIDLAALDGDERFRDLRTRLLNGASLALEDSISRARAAGRLPEDTEPRAVSYVLTAMLAHVAAHQRGLGDFGVPVQQLRTTMARIIGWAAAGEDDPRSA